MKSRLEKVMKMMRTVVGFLLSFFSEQRMKRVKTLRVVPRVAMRAEATPPTTWCWGEIMLVVRQAGCCAH